MQWKKMTETTKHKTTYDELLQTEQLIINNGFSL